MSSRVEHDHRTAHDPEETVGIVLAGGAGRRLGSSAARPGGKAAVLVGGRTLLAGVVAAVEAVVPRVIVVAAERQPIAGLGPRVEIVRDAVAGGGPLTALRDGLAQAAAHGRPARALVVSCDLPLLRPAVLAMLLAALDDDRVQWAVPQVAGHPQVLLSALRPAVARHIEASLLRGRRDVRGVVAELAAADPAAVRVIAEATLLGADPGLESFLDVDTPAALEAMRRRIPPSRE